MKFVGTIKGKPYLIDPETIEAEVRAKIAQSVEKRFGQQCNCDDCKTPQSSTVASIIEFIQGGN